MSMNINSVRGKKLELQTFLSTENPDVVALQETKLDYSIISNEIIPDSLEYDIYRKDRNVNGGGTMLLIKSNLCSTPLNSIVNESESVWAKLTLKGKDHFFASWYRQPDAPVDHLVLFKDQLCKIKTKQKKMSHLVYMYWVILTLEK